MSIALHTTFFDASALAKRFLNEQGSERLRQYWHGQATKYTTPFCFYETLGILKRNLRGTLTKDEYLRAATELVSWYRAVSANIRDLDFTDRNVFADAKRIAEQFNDLDLSDAFQILSVKKGFFSPLVGDSATLFVTADRALAAAARAMELRVWDCCLEPMPTF